VNGRCVALLAVGALAAMPAEAAAKPRLGVSRSSAEAGERVRVAGLGFPPMSRVRVVLGGRIVTRARTGPRGRFRARFVVPTRRPGRYRLTARAAKRTAMR